MADHNLNPATKLRLLNALRAKEAEVLKLLDDVDFAIGRNRDIAIARTNAETSFLWAYKGLQGYAELPTDMRAGHPPAAADEPACAQQSER